MKLELYIIRYGSREELLDSEHSDVCVTIVMALPPEIRARISGVGPSWTSSSGDGNVELRFSPGTFIVSRVDRNIFVPFFLEDAGSFGLLRWQMARYARTGLWIEPREGINSSTLGFRTPHSKWERVEMFALVGAAPLIFPLLVLADNVLKTVRRITGYFKNALRRALPTRAPARARGGAAAAAGPRAGRGGGGARRRTWQDIK
jgi:hypothetical protein